MQLTEKMSSRKSPQRDMSKEQQKDSQNGTVRSSTAGPSHPTAFLPMSWHAAMVFFYLWLFYHAGRTLSVANIAIIKGLNITTFGGPFKYLTHINQWLQLLFFSLQLVADLSPCRWKKNIQRASSFIFTTLVFPTAAEIAIVFWIIYTIDRNLIFPELFDEFLPWYMNHFWHTTIILWVMCEVYLVNHKFPGALVAGITMLTFNSIYIVWLFYIYAVTGHWVYPFLGYLSPLEQAVFFVSNMFLAFGLHLAGKKLSYLCWGRIKETKQD